jgi:hypothetical protein
MLLKAEVENYLKIARKNSFRATPVDYPTLYALCKFWLNHQPHNVADGDLPDDDMMVLVWNGEYTQEGKLENEQWFDNQGNQIDTPIYWFDYPEPEKMP